MGLKYSSFSIHGIDVSQFNGTVDWTKVSAHFSAVRVGYGRTIDTKFVTNWQNAKGRVKRIPYWYMDYYNNHNKGSSVYGMSDEAWGIDQANTCWNSLKNDPEGIVFLDIESGSSSYSPIITTVSSRAQTIAKAFLQRIDQLNGKTNGIYCSLGLLNWFDEWFLDRPLWVAWYDEGQTMTTVHTAVRKAGWHGVVCMWQYSSFGDLDGNGTSDGYSVGMGVPKLDLNAMYAPAWKVIFNEEITIEEPEPEEPVIVIPEEPEETGSYTNYQVTIPILNLRKEPVVSESTLIGKLFTGNPLRISQTFKSGTYLWGRLYGQGWWCCLKEGQREYAIKK